MGRKASFFYILSLDLAFLPVDTTPIAIPRYGATDNDLSGHGA